MPNKGNIDLETLQRNIQYMEDVTKHLKETERIDGNVRSVQFGPWVYFEDLDSNYIISRHECGKWMYFFSNMSFADEICKKAIKDHIVTSCKHSNDETGVCCFYINGNDMVAHKRVIAFFIDNGLIRKTKSGNFYNISFKFDDQTSAGEYASNSELKVKEFQATLKLDNFIDLKTGKWI